LWIPVEVIRLSDALERLDVLSRDHEPELATSLNPPATDAELDVLRAAVQPHGLTEDLEALYRWHNGQDANAHWPVLEAGPLLDAATAAENTERRREICEFPFQWSTAWVSITHLSWQQMAVQVTEPLQGLVIDASFPDPPKVQADSLAAVVEAVCKMIEAGVPLQPPTSGLDDWARARHEVLNPVQGLVVPYLRRLYWSER
jgi:hypothetical protein